MFERPILIPAALFLLHDSHVNINTFRATKRSVSTSILMHIERPLQLFKDENLNLNFQCWSSCWGWEVEVASALHFSTRYFESDAFVAWAKSQQGEEPSDRADAEHTEYKCAKEVMDWLQACNDAQSAAQSAAQSEIIEDLPSPPSAVAAEEANK